MPASLLPVKLIPPEPATTLALTTGHLELIVAGVTVRVHGHVDAASLSTVLDCLVKRA